MCDPTLYSIVHVLYSTDCTPTVQLTQEGAVILGDEEFGKTRSETTKMSEVEEVKPAVKRATTMEQTAKVHPQCVSM